MSHKTDTILKGLFNFSSECNMHMSVLSSITVDEDTFWCIWAELKSYTRYIDGPVTNNPEAKEVSIFVNNRYITIVKGEKV